MDEPEPDAAEAEQLLAQLRAGDHQAFDRLFARYRPAVSEKTRHHLLEIEAKALDLMSPVIGVLKAEQLIATVRQIDNLRSVRELRPLSPRRTSRDVEEESHA